MTKIFQDLFYKNNKLSLLLIGGKLGYFMNHREYMKYDEYLAKGYPIGTGVVESACSHVVKDRMEISGARWGVNGAESVLRLRYVVKSKDWDSYWEFFTSQVREKDFIADDYNSLNIKEKVCA
jgi:hypothetical protein